jgi:ribosomal protein S18 acetylase RimI-like enzyme
MTKLLHLAGAGDLDRLLPMVRAYHAHEGIEQDEDTRVAAVLPLLEGSPHGAVWFIGPKMAPVGYVAVSFGWSIELGGMDGFIDELYVREKVRGRGMATEALGALIPSLEAAGVRALHLEIAPQNEGARRIYARAGFEDRPFGLMSRIA